MKNPLILIVTTEFKSQNLAHSLSSDFEVVSAASGREGLELYQKSFQKIRIVILDLALPDMSGLYLLRELRKISSSVMCIVCADKVNVPIVVEVMREGAFDFLLHPVQSHVLSLSVSAVIRGSNFNVKADLDKFPTFFKFFEKHYKFSLVEALMKEQSVLTKSLSASDFLSLIPNSEEGDANCYEDGLMRDTMLKRFQEVVPSVPESFVLVVEDDPTYNALLASLLSKYYSVISVSDAAEALQACEDYPTISVVILDLVLPDISGVELISTLRKKIANLEVITVTGFSSWETAFQVMKCGASDYLTKPVSKQVLLDSVTTAMERRYQKYVWPEVRMGFVETKLSDQFKITILKDLCKDRLESGALVLMDDLFVCFPELKNTCIPGGVSIPRNLYDNLEEFVLSLKERLSHFSTI